MDLFILAIRVLIPVIAQDAATATNYAALQKLLLLLIQTTCIK